MAATSSKPETETTKACGPLSGYRVLDLGVIFAAPLVAAMLGDFGADVVKVEHPNGDPLRHLPPIPPESHDSLWWRLVGRNKRTMVADLATEDGQSLVRALAAQADVLVENFRPGVLERWDLAPEALLEANPRLVLLRISGFGRQGPYRNRPGFGTIAEAMSGFAELTGWPDRPPTLPTYGLADAVAGVTATVAVLAALLERDTRSGQGQIVDVSLLDSMVSLLGAPPTVYDQLGIEFTRTGNGAQAAPPRGTYLCGDDRWIALSGSTEQITRRLLDCIGGEALVSDPRFATVAARKEHQEELDRLITEFTSARDRDDVLAAFETYEVAAGPVYTIADLVGDENLRAQGTLVRVPDEELGSVLMPNNPIRLSRTPGRIRHAGRRLGQDQADVMHDWLGTPTAEIAPMGVQT